MKKNLAASLLASTALFALTNEQIVEFYSKMVPQGVSVSVEESFKVNENIDGFVVKISNGQVSQEDVIFGSGDMMLPEVVDIKQGKSYKAEFEEKRLAKKLAGIYKAEDKKHIISLGNDPKKPTQIMFSDPECPYCRAELANIEQTLKEVNLKLIMTPVHDTSALQKSFLIYKDVAKAKTDSDKVKVLRKYFDQKYTVKEGSVSEADVKKMDDLRQKYFSAGVRSVPKFVDESSLK